MSLGLYRHSNPVLKHCTHNCSLVYIRRHEGLPGSSVGISLCSDEGDSFSRRWSRSRQRREDWLRDARRGRSRGWGRIRSRDWTLDLTPQGPPPATSRPIRITRRNASASRYSWPLRTSS
ncbi:unnamed protein product [Nezara viridula]|uniref:Uncharacterized protein n=1 Tax=Nezara viridula TaxID=85310 RepID=A0A9P0MWX4_NEZVI|nr:unnamed protein product [Nezara viridula]